MPLVSPGAGISSHIIADCMALCYNRMDPMKKTHLETPYQWDIIRLLKFLEPIADKMEDTEASPRQLTLLARYGTRVKLLDSVAVPRGISSHPPHPGE